MEVLGVMLDNKGSTETSIAHITGLAEGNFYKNQRSLTRKGNVRGKPKSWTATIVAIAMHGCRTWHMTRELVHRSRTWELKWLRKILRLKPIPKLGEEFAGGMAYNQRTAKVCYDRCNQYGVKTMPRKVLEALHGEAWREAEHPSRVGGWIRQARAWNSATNQQLFGGGRV